MVNVLQKIQGRKWEFAALLVIVFVGIFFRTYHFHDWLHFGSDQARDIVLIDHVVQDGASWPAFGPDASNTHFKLGPMYYYFQIISRKLFGDDPSVMAYPDLLFSVLSLPLFFFLLRRYFVSTIAMALTGLFAISFYMVEYSRFAWNTNPIPFFVLLFFYSALKFLESSEKTSLGWVILWGVSIGVGIQLHTLLLLLLPCISLVLSFSLFWSTPKVWGRLILALSIVFLLNAGEIRSEIETGGANLERFLIASADRSGSGASRFLKSLEMDLLDHAEANTHIVSSLGDKANFIFPSILFHPEKIKNRLVYTMYLGGISLSILFSVFGYGRLGYLAWNERDIRKKQFLVLVLVYASLSFLIMFSVARGMPLRYFIHAAFVPFILLGLLIDWMKANIPKRYGAMSVLVVVGLLLIANGNSLRVEAEMLASGTRGDSGYVVLGDAEHMVDYIIQEAAPQKEANFFGGTNYAVTYYKSLKYLAEKKQFVLNPIERRVAPISDDPYFFIAKSLKKGESFDINSYYRSVGNKNFGRVGIYHLKKQ